MKLFKSIFGQQELVDASLPQISSADFKKLITKYFAPKLREKGWTGTGFHYRKFTDNHFIYLLSFYPDKYGKQCWVEVGVHLDFLKNIGGTDYDLKKIDCSWLDIRRRISPDKSDNYTWKYLDTEDKNKIVLENIWDTFMTNGQDFFIQFKEFPSPFQEIEITDIDKRNEKYQVKGLPLPSDVRTAWLLAQVYDYIGDKKKAVEFANFGLSRIQGQQGSALSPDLEKIKSKNGS